MRLHGAPPRAILVGRRWRKVNETKLAKSNAREYIARHYCPDNYPNAPEPPFTDGKLDMGKFREMASFIIDVMDDEIGHDTQWYRVSKDDYVIDSLQEWLVTSPNVLKMPCFGDSALQTLAALYELPIEYLQRCGVSDDAEQELAYVFASTLKKADEMTIDERDKEVRAELGLE